MGGSGQKSHPFGSPTCETKILPRTLFDADMPCPGTLRLRLGQMLGLRTYSLECSTYVTHGPNGPNEVLGSFTHARTFMMHCARLMRVFSKCVADFVRYGVRETPSSSNTQPYLAHAGWGAHRGFGFDHQWSPQHIETKGHHDAARSQCWATRSIEQGVWKTGRAHLQ